MAAFSLRVVEETWEPSLVNCITLEWHNGIGYRIAARISFVKSAMPESLNMPHSSPLEHTWCTGVSGEIQVRLPGNLGKYRSSSSIEVMPHKKAVELK